MRSATFGLLFAGLLACGGDPTPTPAPAPPKTLVLITVDTLRADRLGVYGSDRGLTPRIDAWAERSLVFDAAYAPTPFTVPSLVSLHTGQHPLELGLQSNLSAISADATTLAEHLSRSGWKTAAVVSNPVLRRRADIAQGFEIWDDTMPQREAVRRWPERIAGPTTNAALRALDAWADDPEARQAPLFLWVHYQDPHGPYTPPPGYRERLLPAERERDPRRLPTDRDSHGQGGVPRYQAFPGQDEAAYYRASYDAEIAYLDREVGRLLDALQEKGWDERVVFAADHGESMGEDDYWFAHGNDLTDPLVRVPLVLRLPGVGSGRRTDIVRLADLHPTLAHAVLGHEPDLPGDARNLLAPGARDTDSTPLLTTLSAYPHPRFALVEDGYKLIITRRDGTWNSRLYRHGHEDVDLAAPAPQVARRMRERIAELRAARTREERAHQLTLSEESRRHLEALGYVETDPE